MAAYAIELFAAFYISRMNKLILPKSSVRSTMDLKFCMRIWSIILNCLVALVYG